MRGLITLLLVVAGCSPRGNPPKQALKPLAGDTQSAPKAALRVSTTRFAESEFFIGLRQLRDTACACKTLACVASLAAQRGALSFDEEQAMQDEDLLLLVTVENELEACSRGLAPVAKLSVGHLDKVRAPLESDLPEYVRGIVGVGKLHAAIKTSMGTIVCSLEETAAPIAVANFVGLARGLHWFKEGDRAVRRPFYDGLLFHRVIPKFVIQGGDPTGLGSGGPGYRFRPKAYAKVLHDRPGALAMANMGPGTEGSQFYITTKATPRLDQGFAVFGYCKDHSVINAIATVPTASGRSARPQTDVIIERIDFFRSP